jgi:hypothetical protein
MAAGQGLQPRAAVVKPAHTVLEAYHRTDVIQVKFRDDAPVRLRGGALTDLGTGVLDEARDVLAALTGVTWQPLIAAAEPDLEDLRQAAQRNLGRGVADFRVWFRAFLPPHLGAEEAIDALNGLECVELAEPVQEAAPLPIPPLFANEQPYLNAGPVGAGAYPTWEHLGIRGINVNVVDIEFGWEIFHQDLPTVNLIQAGDPPLTQAEEDHGTATLGVLGALDNNFGTTGMAPQATLGFAAARVGGVVSAGTAWVPVEWDLASYNAIVAAAGAGRIVIEPAGNGAQNLDAAIYQTGNGGHWPFLAQNDSGAIMVGAGMPPIIHGGLDLDRSRICCSNYGSRVDVQGQGWKVFSTGYGDWHAEASGQLDYTDDYAGTSSAAATIAGAAALVQSAFKWFNNSNVLSPAGMRQVLINSGSAQQSAVNNSFPATQNIGPRPDASIAILLAVGGCLPLYDTTVGNPGLPDNVIDLLSFNDGSGNKLFASGRFEMTPPNGHVAEWDGTSWSSVGVDPFVGNFVNALEVYDDGSGPQLYAGGGGGSFGGVSVWDGSAWTRPVQQCPRRRPRGEPDRALERDELVSRGQRHERRRPGAARPRRRGRARPVRRGRLHNGRRHVGRSHGPLERHRVVGRRQRHERRRCAGAGFVRRRRRDEALRRRDVYDAEQPLPHCRLGRRAVGDRRPRHDPGRRLQQCL